MRPLDAGGLPGQEATAASERWLLAVNPGSTSTKLALFSLAADGPRELTRAELKHSARELAEFTRVAQQFPFRMAAVEAWLAEALPTCGSPEVDDSRAALACVVGRGGVLKPLAGGTYRVGPRMVAELRAGGEGEHASNLGALIAARLARRFGVPAYIVDPVVVDELRPEARLTGLPELAKRSLFHALNQRAVARRAAGDLGRRYQECRLVVAHLGGGITVGAHRFGRVVDVNNGLDGDGPMSPERAGSLPTLGLVSMCFSWRYRQPELMRRVVGGGGLVAHLGVNDAREAERRAEQEEDDRLRREAVLALDALAYQVAKEVGRAAVALGPLSAGERVDAVVLTGGLAHSQRITSLIAERVRFLAPVLIYPGEDEMRSLAEGAWRVEMGHEPALEYEPEAAP